MIATPITDEELAQWREKANTATQGPWAAQEPYSTHEWRPWSVWAGADAIARINASHIVGRERADAEMIAISRSAMPRLIDAYEALREENERLRSALEWIADEKNLDCVMRCYKKGVGFYYATHRQVAEDALKESP